MKHQKGFAQLYVAIALGVFILALLGGLRYMYKDVQKLSGEKAVQGAVIAIQQDSIVKDQKSDQATETVTTGVTVKKEEIVQKGDRNRDKLDAEVERIKKEYRALQAAAQSEAQRQVLLTQQINAVSAQRIDALWTGYCNAAPTAADCKPAPEVKPAKTAALDDTSVALSDVPADSSEELVMDYSGTADLPYEQPTEDTVLAAADMVLNY